MMAAWSAFFTLFTTMFNVVTKLANAGSELATFAEEEAAAVNTRARMSRNQAMTIAMHTNKEHNKALGVSEDGLSITDATKLPATQK